MKLKFTVKFLSRIRRKLKVENGKIMKNEGDFGANQDWDRQRVASGNVVSGRRVFTRLWLFNGLVPEDRGSKLRNWTFLLLSLIRVFTTP